MVDEAHKTEAAPVLIAGVLGDVLTRVVAVLKAMRQETVHVSQSAYDAVSAEIAKLEEDAKSAGLISASVTDTLGAVVAHLQMDEHRPLPADISVAVPPSAGDTPA